MSLKGWYACAFAAEPFVVSAVATYVPLLLAELAGENAVWVGDHRTPCARAGDEPGLPPLPIAPPQCVVRLGSFWIDQASLPLYTFSASVFVQTILVISVSGIADRGAHRKALLVGFAVFGALATILLGFLGHTHYYAAALLAVAANASFGVVGVCGNAYLPTLVSAQLAEQQIRRQTAADRFRNAFPRIADNPEVTSAQRAQLSAKISGTGSAIGYGAALFVQVATMAVLLLPASPAKQNTRLQLVVALIGWWWLLGQGFVVWWLPAGSGDAESAPLGVGKQLTAGWRGLVRTARQARQLRDLATFLAGWFLLTDAVTTINSTAVLFARTDLRMGTPALALVGLVTVFFAVVGSLLLSRRRSPGKALVVVSLLGAAVPAYGILGFLQPFVGLRHAWEIYVLATWHGLVLGAISTIARSQFALLIPAGREAMFFALYAVTDKGSSVIGPSVTGIITDRTHNIRYVFYLLLGMMLLAAFLFAQVDFERGAQAAEEAEDGDEGAVSI